MIILSFFQSSSNQCSDSVLTIMSSSASDRLDQVLELYQSTYQYPDIDELTQLLCDITHDEKMDILEKNSTLNTAALSRHMEL